MRAHDRHADTRGGDGDVGLAPDLVRLLHHLHLLLVVAVARHRRVVAEQVEGILRAQQEQHLSTVYRTNFKGVAYIQEIQDN